MIDAHITSDLWWNNIHNNNSDQQNNNIRDNLVKTNPLYNEEKYKAREYDEKHMELETSVYIPKCPICGSPNVEKISTANKVGRGVLFGIFSIGTIGKTYRCKNCNYKF